MTQYAKLNDAQWVKAQNDATRRYVRDVLGERPTLKSVAADLPNDFKLDIVERLAILVLLVLTIFTSFKAGTYALSMSPDAMTHLSGGAAVATIFDFGFTLFFVIALIMMATPGLIYFILLDDSPGILARKKDTAHYPWTRHFGWPYIYPRVPGVAIYGIIAWLFFVSSHGRPLVGEWWEIAAIIGARYLPVVFEIGLAHLVGDILTKSRNFEFQVKTIWKTLVTTYDEKFKARGKDPEYQRILFHAMRDTMLAIRRKKQQPNAWMETAEEEVVTRIILAEYKRLQAGLAFARMVDELDRAQRYEVRELQEPKPARRDPKTGRRKPPRGDKHWTVESLCHDFEVRGVDPHRDYTEAMLQTDYEANFGARSAWRQGAKTYFTNGRAPIPQN